MKKILFVLFFITSLSINAENWYDIVYAPGKSSGWVETCNRTCSAHGGPVIDKGFPNMRYVDSDSIWTIRMQCQCKQ